MVADYHTDWTAADAIVALKADLAAFCERVVSLSTQWSPPAVNAANGIFRNSMMTDPELDGLAHPNVSASDSDGAALYSIVSAFEQGLKSAFQPENYGATAFTNANLFLKALDKFGSDVGNIIKDIVDVYRGNVDIQKIAADINKLIDDIKKKGPVLSGAHANGWIESNVKGVAKSVSTLVAGSKLNTNEAQDFAKFIVKVCDNLVGIPDFANNPWLYAEWQLRFQTIMQSTAATLRANPNG